MSKYRGDVESALSLERVLRGWNLRAPIPPRDVRPVDHPVTMLPEPPHERERIGDPYEVPA